MSSSQGGQNVPKAKKYNTNWHNIAENSRHPYHTIPYGLLFLCLFSGLTDFFMSFPAFWMGAGGWGRRIITETNNFIRRQDAVHTTHNTLWITCGMAMGGCKYCRKRVMSTWRSWFSFSYVAIYFVWRDGDGGV